MTLNSQFPCYFCQQHVQTTKTTLENDSCVIYNNWTTGKLQLGHTALSLQMKQMIIVRITAYWFCSMFCSVKTILMINSTIKQYAECLPSCPVWLAQVRSTMGRSAQLNQCGPCLWWARAEKGDGMGWEGRSGNWVGPGGFWRPPGEGEVSKLKQGRGRGQQAAF